MKGLLGFAVLTGPLWLILLALILGLWAAFVVAKRFASGGAKVATGIGILALAFLVLFGDELAGRAYLNYLCASEAGVKVYQTVELPAEYWDKEGKAKFYDEKNGNFYLSKEYPSEWRIENHSSLLHVDKRVSALRDQTKKKTYAEEVSFMYWGGWIRRNLSPNNSAVSCGNDLEQFRSFMRQAFKPANSK